MIAPGPRGPASPGVRSADSDAPIRPPLASGRSPRAALAGDWRLDGRVALSVAGRAQVRAATGRAAGQPGSSATERSRSAAGGLERERPADPKGGGASCSGAWAMGRTRRVRAVPPAPVPSASPKGPARPHPLLVAVEWARQLRDGVYASRAAIARAHGVSRARVTQIMNLLRLPTKRRNELLAHLAGGQPVSSERRLRNEIRPHRRHVPGPASENLAKGHA